MSGVSAALSPRAGIPALSRSALQRKKTMLKRARDPDSDGDDDRDQFGDTNAGKALRDAAERGDIAGIDQALKEVDVDVALTGAYLMDTTPIHFAIGCHQNKAVRRLLQRGADVNLRRGFRTPLHSAVHALNLGAFRMLLDAGADPRLPDDNGRNPSYRVNEKLHEIREEIRKKSELDSDEDEDEIDDWNMYECRAMLYLMRSWLPPLPSWSVLTHSQYSSGFKNAVFAFMCSMHRIAPKFPRDLRLLLVEKIGEAEEHRWSKKGHWPDSVPSFEIQEFDPEAKEEACVLM